MINYNNFKKKDYNDLFTKQNGRCAICGMHQNDLIYKLQVDHNHKTNLVRGLLCISCNMLLGQHKDERSELGKHIKKCKTKIIILKRAIEYLNADINRNTKGIKYVVANPCKK